MRNGDVKPEWMQELSRLFKKYDMSHDDYRKMVEVFNGALAANSIQANVTEQKAALNTKGKGRES